MKIKYALPDLRYPRKTLQYGSKHMRSRVTMLCGSKYYVYSETLQSLITYKVYCIQIWYILK